MSAVEIIGAILLVIGSILVVALVAMQEPKSDGVSALSGNSAFVSTGGRDRSLDGRINRLVKILAIAFFVIVIAVYAITIYL